MRLFIYEFVTGGGMWSLGPDSPPAGSLLREGQAMLRALVDDFANDAGVEVRLIRDTRLPPDESLQGTVQLVSSASDERRLLAKIARESDAVLVIAPEIGGVLLERVRWVEDAGARLLSPGSDFIGWTANKNLLAERLRQAGVQVPRGTALTQREPLPRDFPYPAVLKPADGAGSCGIQKIADADCVVDRSTSSSWRLEEFRPGISSSVAILNGPTRRIPLPAMCQRLGGPSGFEYLGGAGPLPDRLDRRARHLALAALEALPTVAGYVGVDLVLGEDVDGRQDYVIEINPRLTTSYVGLRRLSVSNLAAAMLDVAEGRAGDLRFHTGSLEFDSDGGVTLNSSSV